MPPRRTRRPPGVRVRRRARATRAVQAPGRTNAAAGRRSWIAWNEPNNPVFLQAAVRADGRWAMQSAKDYGRSATPSSGGEAGQRRTRSRAASRSARQQPAGAVRPSVSPIAFLRAMRKAGARGSTPTRTTRTTATDRDAEDQAAARQARCGADRGHPRQHRHADAEISRLYGNTRIWVTEYGYQTNPPDTLFGVS